MGTSGIHHVTLVVTDPPRTAEGESLKLPPGLEPQREGLEETLPPLRLPAVGSK